MKKTQTLAVAFCVVYSMLAGGLATYGESFSDLTITGTATIEALNSGTASVITLTSTTANLGLLGVSGTADISGNCIYFGSLSDDPTYPGLSIKYDDGNNGAGAMITQIATRPLAEWNWQRPGSTVNAMQLDGSNRLILSGTATSNPPQIMLDPNGAGISINGNSLLTQVAANALYIPTNSGIVLSDGNVQMGNLAIGTYSGSAAPVSSLVVSGSVGIGTTTPQSALDVAGDIHASGMLIEKKTTFSPSSVGWYRIISAGNFSAGTVRMSKNYNNNITDIEFQYNIWGYGVGGAINVTRAARYCVVDQIRVSSNGGSGVYLDVHICEAANNGAQMVVYGYGPWLDGLQVNPAVDAVAGSSSVSVLPVVGKGFATTEAITFGNGSTITGTATTGTTASTPTLVVGGNIQSSGGALIEQKITFTPTTVGWYRIISWGNMTSGILRIYGDYDNRVSEEEIEFYIGYGGGSIQQVRHSNYNGGIVSQVRANRHSTGAVSFDIYVSSATAPRTITIYGFGPRLGGMLANPTVGAEPGDKEVRTLTLGDGFRSTNGAIFAETSGYVGIGTSSPQATLDVHGGVRISGNLSVSGSGSLTLADGTVLSSSNTLRSVLANGTASTISGSILANQVTGLAALIPTDNLQLANGAGYITASGTAAFAQTCTTATTLSGTIQTSQIQGIDPVTNGGNLDYSRINNVPSNLVAIATGGTASNVALSGTTRVSGGIIVSGTLDAASNTVVATGSNQLVLIPQQGDLSMGTFTAGKQPQ